MKRRTAYLTGGLALAALAVGPASAACSGANCAMAGGGTAYKPGQVIVSNPKLISQDGSGLRNAVGLKPGGGQLLSPGNGFPMRGTGR